MAFDNLAIAASFEFAGTFLIGIAVLLTHRRIRKEHRIDIRVEEEIKHERWVSILGLFLITIGFIIHFRALVFG